MSQCLWQPRFSRSRTFARERPTTSSEIREGCGVGPNKGPAPVLPTVHFNMGWASHELEDAVCTRQRQHRNLWLRVKQKVLLHTEQTACANCSRSCGCFVGGPPIHEIQQSVCGVAREQAELRLHDWTRFGTRRDHGASKIRREVMESRRPHVLKRRVCPRRGVGTTHP